MKTKMFGYVKNLLRKWVEMPDENQPAPVVTAPPAPAPWPVMAPRPEGAPDVR